MFREFRFRAWDKKNKKMIYNPSKYGEVEQVDLNHTINSIQKDHELMQYTGLKDRTGKDIYEGDILSLNYFEGEVVKMWIEYLDTLPYCCTIIKYSEGDWVPLGRIMKRDREQFTCEVIGNIYEHPELIK
jgi:uncharacterized phage protein (TIGR01671 family)